MEAWFGRIIAIDRSAIYGGKVAISMAIRLGLRGVATRTMYAKTRPNTA